MHELFLVRSRIIPCPPYKQELHWQAQDRDPEHGVVVVIIGERHFDVGGEDCDEQRDRRPGADLSSANWKQEQSAHDLGDAAQLYDEQRVAKDRRDDERVVRRMNKVIDSGAYVTSRHEVEKEFLGFGHAWVSVSGVRDPLSGEFGSRV